jgi:hypothetical protein
MEEKEEQSLRKNKGKELQQETQLPNQDPIQSEVCLMKIIVNKKWGSMF